MQLTPFQPQIAQVGHATHGNSTFPAELTSSAEVDGSTYRGGALQGAGVQPFSDVQVTHLEVETIRINVLKRR